MRKLNIVWVGCHSEGLKAFKSILERGFNISKFVTLDDEAFEKRAAGTREYVNICSIYNVPVGLITTIKNEKAYRMIKDANPDLLVVLGWSEILPADILNIPTIGTVGAHAAMLPHNRGSAPINWALIKGETECGNSLMWLDSEVDKGEIIDQIGFNITPYDTCATLYDKVAETNEIMLISLIERLSNNQTPIMCKKNNTDEPLLPRRRPKDGLLNWECSNIDVYNFIRALTKPYPGAFSFLNKKKYLILSASLLSDKAAGNPGLILGTVYSPINEACGIQVSCATGSVIIHELEDESGKSYVGRNLINLQLIGKFESV